MVGVLPKQFFGNFSRKSICLYIFCAIVCLKKVCLLFSYIMITWLRIGILTHGPLLPNASKCCFPISRVKLCRWEIWTWPDYLFIWATAPLSESFQDLLFIPGALEVWLGCGQVCLFLPEFCLPLYAPFQLGNIFQFRKVFTLVFVLFCL